MPQMLIELNLFWTQNI